MFQNTPGVLTDRINVGGNESGHSMAYVGPGSAEDQAVWSLDGIAITDMAALGLSGIEVKDLCAEIQKAGWTKITLSRPSPPRRPWKSPSRRGRRRRVRGYLAVVLQDRACTEPPPEVLAEAARYLRR